MTARIRIQPSGHEFLVEKDETILEGALRSGLNLNYHCSNGSCGECKARVVSGAVSAVQHHDYVLSEQEKAAGHVLLCRARADSDLVLEASEAGSVEDIPVQQLTTQVYRSEWPIEDVAVITLRTPRSQTLRFLAGQHITLKIDNLAPRNKSIASCPCNGMFLQFHQRRKDGDAFSDYVFTQLKNRQKVQVEGPFGGFVLDEASNRPAIFIAYETGFSPIKSVIEHAISLDVPQAIRLYWITRRDNDHYMANFCRSWESVLDDFCYVQLSSESAETMIAPASDSALDVAGQAMVHSAKRVVEDHPDLSGYDVYINGPQSILLATRDLLLAHGLPGDRLFVDPIKRF